MYYRQEVGSRIEFFAEGLPQDQYTLSTLALGLNTLTYPLLTHTVTASEGTDKLTLTMTSAASNGTASEELRILTDDELRQLDVENNCDISGTDWVYTVILFDGAYTGPFGSTAGVTVSVDPSYPHWYYYHFDSDTGPQKTSQPLLRPGHANLPR